MDRQVRKKWSMATSVRTFSRAHPSADPSYTLVLDRLDGTIVRSWAGVWLPASSDSITAASPETWAAA